MQAAMRSITLFLAVVALAAGCAAPARSKDARPAVSPISSASARPPSRSAFAAEREVDCGNHRQQPNRPLPAAFVTEVAVRCALMPRETRGRSHLVWTKQVADHALAPLIAALRRPSVEPSPGEICTAPLVFVPLLFLIDHAGHVVRPLIPANSCRQPQQQVLDTLRLVPWVTAHP